MSIEAVQALSSHDEVAPALPQRAERPAAPGGTSFAESVSEGLRAVNEQLLSNQQDLQALATGEPVSLHEMMVRLEESRMSLQLMLQVRNRVLDAYQDVMRMQV